jgi:hypothetical protein
MHTDRLSIRANPWNEGAGYREFALRVYLDRLRLEISGRLKRFLEFD